MIIKILFSYLIGYLKINVEGYYIERFINLCRNNKIMTWNLNRKNDIELEVKVRVDDFKEVCQIAKKTKCKVKIIKKRGFPFLWNRYKKRKIFFAFLLILILLTILSSNFVWNVDIQEENGKELENIAQDVENAGLKTGNNNIFKFIITNISIHFF